MIEISFQYSPFLNLQVLHNYYSKSLRKELKFVPTQETLELVKHSNLILKETEQGFLVSYDVQEPDRMIKFIDEQPDLKFEFFLVTSNLFFTNLTQMATESVDSVFYFDAKDAKKQDGENYLLHKDDFVTTAYSLGMGKDSYIFRLANTSPTTLEVKDQQGKVVIEAKVDKLEAYAFPLANLTQGIYTIFENGKEKRAVCAYYSGFSQDSNSGYGEHTTNQGA